VGAGRGSRAIEAGVEEGGRRTTEGQNRERGSPSWARDVRGREISEPRTIPSEDYHRQHQIPRFDYERDSSGTRLTRLNVPSISRAPSGAH
jgi:hypothetical protein